jgi:hypothetical protein
MNKDLESDMGKMVPAAGGIKPACVHIPAFMAEGSADIAVPTSVIARL